MAHEPSHSFSGQRAKILALLIAARGGEVPLPEIRACAAQYNTRIFELRRAGYRIPPPRVETVNGHRHTWYRLERTAPVKVSPQEPRCAVESLFPDDTPSRHLDLG